MVFKPATKAQSKLRLALMGPSGSGKTYSALELATNLGSKVALIDSERGSASKYADLFKFDVNDLDNHAPQTYVKTIKEAEAAGYDVLVIDSLSHAWNGKDGALDQVDKAAKKSQSGNSFTAWREVTPHHNALVDAILQTKCHVIVTMRTKMEYILEENDKGRKVPKKVGMAPIQRDGVEYEFDVVADMNLEHDLIVTKTRCHLIDGLVVNKPGKELATTLRNWLESGVAPAPKPAASASASAATSPPATSASKPSAEAAPAASTAESSKETAEKPAGTTEDGKDDEPVGRDQMNQLLKVGTVNNWTRDDINGFLAKEAVDGKVTWKAWTAALKSVSEPKPEVANAG